MGIFVRLIRDSYLFKLFEVRGGYLQDPIGVNIYEMVGLAANIKSCANEDIHVPLLKIFEPA